MATERLNTCKICGDRDYKSNMIKYKSKTMCKKCYAIEKKLSEEKEDLCNTIKELYNLPYVMPGHLKQIKQFREEYKFTYAGMKLTLLYCKNVLNLEFSTSRGLGIIPYQYEAAKNDFIRKRELTKQVENKNVTNEVKRIVTSVKVENTYLKNRMMSLEEL